MNFIEMWNEAIANDPYWQFEEILEEEPGLARVLWYDTRVQIQVEKNLTTIIERKVKKLGSGNPN